MRILIACEFSGRVREAFRARGHRAYSCDLLPAEDGSVYHYQGDVFECIKAMRHAEPIDLMIAHPPCTYLTRSGMRWLKDQKPLKSGKPVGAVRRQLLAESIEFFEKLWAAPVHRICIENPRSFLIPIPATQYVQPWHFGDEAFKTTGLWLKNLPALKPTNKLTPPQRGTPEHKAWSGIHRASPGPDRARERSRTYAGIATAFAEQWGDDAGELGLAA